MKSFKIQYICQVSVKKSCVYHGGSNRRGRMKKHEIAQPVERRGGLLMDIQKETSPFDVKIIHVINHHKSSIQGVILPTHTPSWVNRGTIAAMRSSWIKLKVWSGQVAHLFHSAIQICPSRHGPCRERIRSFTRSLIVGKQLDMTHLSIVSRVERIEKGSTNLIQKHFTSLASWNSSFMDEHVSTTTHEHCLTHSTSVHIFESQSAVWSSPGGLRGFHPVQVDRWWIRSWIWCPMMPYAYGSMLILQISLHRLYPTRRCWPEHLGIPTIEKWENCTRMQYHEVLNDGSTHVIGRPKMIKFCSPFTVPQPQSWTHR